MNEGNVEGKRNMYCSTPRKRDERKSMIS